MSKKHFLRGLRDGIPIGLGYFAVSFGIGISAHNAHLSIFQGFLLSFLNNASSGEYGGITIIAADSGLWAMALMMLVVNARYLLMSCALSQRLSPNTPLPWRLLIAYDLTDEIFGLAIAQPHVDRAFEQISPVERGVILIGTWELKHRLDIPYRVVINESVELAKSFGGTDGHKYVNGVLDKAAGDLRPVEVKARQAARKAE